MLLPEDITLIKTVCMTKYKNAKRYEQLIKNTSSAAKRKKLDGGERHVTDDQIEENLLEWIFDRPGKGLCVSRKLIIFKSKKLQEEKQKVLRI